MRKRSEKSGTAGTYSYTIARIGVESRDHVYEFVYRGKRFQGSTGAIAKTLAREHENGRTPERERAAGLPSKKQGGVPKSTMLVLMGHMSRAMIYRLLILLVSAEGIEPSTY